MEGYTTEQEQLDELKKWWAINGKSVLMGLAIVLLAVAGWRYWTGSQAAKQEEASAIYEQIAAAVEANQTDVITERAGALISQYSNTPYAVLAALTLAKTKQAAGDQAAAQSYLQWVLDHNSDEALNHIARLRLAATLWSQNKPDEALTLLKSVDPGAYVARYEELRGDILASKGDVEGAKQAYKIALEKKESGADDIALLQMKLDDLGSVVNAQ